MARMVLAPPDTVAGMVGFLTGRGVHACTKLPLDFQPGIVRVSRVGGGPVNASQDEAILLLECWEQTHEEAFDSARRLWGEIALIDVDNQEAFPGLTCYEAYPESAPVMVPDPDAPTLVRYQFTVRLLCSLEEVTL